MKLNAIQIKESCNGRFIVEPADTTVFAINACIDSRKVVGGTMFVAMQGEKVDGHNFVRSAIENGASVIIVQKQIDLDVCNLAIKNKTSIILVENSQKALQDVAQFWRGYIQGKVIGITGSTGKTTTRNLVHDVLASKYKCYASPENYNNELGLPITICNCDEDVDFLICEMGMYERGDIDFLCKIAKPQYGLITNIGDCHMERLGSKDNIAKAKTELACGVEDKFGKMFLPCTDYYRDFIIDRAKLNDRSVEVVLFGDDKFNKSLNYSQIWAENIHLDDNACASFELCYKNKGQNNVIKESCKLNIQGLHNVKNALGAASVAISCNMSLKECALALKDVKLQSGRADIVETSYGFSIINDAYNANPQSMKASINMFNSLKTNKLKVLVLGDMAELGNISKAAHQKIGKHIAGLDFNKLICVGKNAKDICCTACEYGMDKNDTIHFDNNLKVVDYLKNNLDKNYLVLIKASNCMKFEDIVNSLM